MQFPVIQKITFLFISILLLSSCGSGQSTIDSSSYDVTSQANISRVRISKTGGDNNRIEIIIRGRSQMTSSGPEDVYLQGSSGMQENSSFRGYDEVSFPFTGNVSFDYTKQANDVTGSTPGETETLATSVRASVGFIIKEPGHWRVNIYY